MLANHSSQSVTTLAGGLKLTAGFFSSAGCKAKNEDALTFASPSARQESTKGVLALVADGVSHSKQPAEASEYCASQFNEKYFNSPASWSTQNSISNALTQINNHLIFGADNENTAKSTAINSRAVNFQWLSTISGIVFRSNTAHIFHVGDSQIIRVRNNKITRLTQPHNQKLANNTRVLTRAMGADNQLKVDYLTTNLTAGDCYILTTDGIHDFVNQSRLKYLSRDITNPQEFAKALVDEAQTNGSDDNLTCIIIKVEQVPKPHLEELHRQLFSKHIPPSLKPGHKIDDYQVIRVLHASARSHLYLVESVISREKFVLKAPSQNLSDDEVYLQGFIREAWVGRQVDSPLIMKIFPSTSKSKHLYHICEYVEGQSLRQWIHDNPTPSIGHVREIAEQIANALRLLKRLQIVHRDLKPENLMITNSGDIKLIDFGTASIASLDENINQVSESIPAGTLNYVAPETVENLTSSFQSDLFSFGVIVYEMLTGVLPYPPQSKQVQKSRSRNQWRYKSALDIRADLPFWLDLALNRAVEKDPAHRYEAYSQFIVDLSRPNINAEEAYQNRPLIERNPIKFWQTVSGALTLGVIFLSIKLATL